MIKEEKKEFLKITTKFVTPFRITGVLNDSALAKNNGANGDKVRFVATQSLPLRKVIEVKLTLSAAHDSVVFNGKVIYSNLVDGNQTYETGLEIVQISLDDKEKLLNAIKPSDK